MAWWFRILSTCPCFRVKCFNSQVLYHRSGSYRLDLWYFTTRSSEMKVTAKPPCCYTNTRSCVVMAVRGFRVTAQYYICIANIFRNQPMYSRSKKITINIDLQPRAWEEETS